MYKVLLVDCDPSTRNHIIRTMDWDALDVSEVLQAHDGQLGLHLAIQSHPDLVITDIEFPMIDGLKMIQCIQEKLPETQFIILTEKTEISHLSAAIQLGVCDYIMQPATTYTIFSSINKVIRRLTNQRVQQTANKNHLAQWQELRPFIQESLLNQIITSQTPMDNLEQKMIYTDLNLSYDSYTVCVFDVGVYDKNDKEQFDKVSKQLYKSMAKRVKPYGILFTNYNHQQVLIIKDLDIAGGFTHIEFQNLAESYTQRFAEKNQCYVNMGIGMTVYNIDQLHQSYQSACHMLSYNTSLGNNTVFDFQRLGYKEREFVLPNQLIEDVLKSFYLNTDFYEKIDQIIECLSESKNLVPSNLRTICVLIVGRIHQILFEANVNIELYLEEMMQESCTIDTLDDFKILLNQILSQTYAYLHNNDHSHAQVLVLSAKQYIEENYNDVCLNLNKVAAHIFISPSYLSSIFKKEVGMSFVDYITEVRIQKALTLFKSKPIKAYEVARSVGYHDSQYFSVCFKKHTGMSPREYKKALPSEL